MPGKYDVVCAKGCGFRADSDYFVRKTRFTPGICPRCSAAISVVARAGDTPIPGLKIDVGERSGNYREVVEV